MYSLCLSPLAAAGSGLFGEEDPLPRRRRGDRSWHWNFFPVCVALRGPQDSGLYVETYAAEGTPSSVESEWGGVFRGVFLWLVVFCDD